MLTTKIIKQAMDSIYENRINEDVYSNIEDQHIYHEKEELTQEEVVVPEESEAFIKKYLRDKNTR